MNLFGKTKALFIPIFLGLIWAGSANATHGSPVSEKSGTFSAQLVFGQNQLVIQNAEIALVKRKVDYHYGDDFWYKYPRIRKPVPIGSTGLFTLPYPSDTSKTFLQLRLKGGYCVTLKPNWDEIAKEMELSQVSTIPVDLNNFFPFNSEDKDLEFSLGMNWVHDYLSWSNFIPALKSYDCERLDSVIHLLKSNPQLHLLIYQYANVTDVLDYGPLELVWLYLNDHGISANNIHMVPEPPSKSPASRKFSSESGSTAVFLMLDDGSHPLIKTEIRSPKGSIEVAFDVESHTENGTKPAAPSVVSEHNPIPRKSKWRQYDPIQFHTLKIKEGEIKCTSLKFSGGCPESGKWSRQLVFIRDGQNCAPFPNDTSCNHLSMKGPGEFYFQIQPKWEKSGDEPWSTPLAGISLKDLNFKFWQGKWVPFYNWRNGISIHRANDPNQLYSPSWTDSDERFLDDLVTFLNAHPWVHLLIYEFPNDRFPVDYKPLIFVGATLQKKGISRERIHPIPGLPVSFPEKVKSNPSEELLNRVHFWLDDGKDLSIENQLPWITPPKNEVAH